MSDWRIAIKFEGRAVEPDFLDVSEAMNPRMLNDLLVGSPPSSSDRFQSIETACYGCGAEAGTVVTFQS